MNSTTPSSSRSFASCSSIDPTTTCRGELAIVENNADSASQDPVNLPNSDERPKKRSKRDIRGDESLDFLKGSWWVLSMELKEEIKTSNDLSRQMLKKMQTANELRQQNISAQMYLAQNIMTIFTTRPSC